VKEMDIQKAKQIYEDDKYENKKWDKDCPLFTGLKILDKYRFKGEKYDFNFGHEQIWIGDFGTTVGQMSEEEVIVMFENGWFESEDAWSLFS
jgi:hypothetical protein